VGPVVGVSVRVRKNIPLSAGKNYCNYCFVKCHHLKSLYCPLTFLSNRGSIMDLPILNLGLHTAHSYQETSCFSQFHKTIETTYIRPLWLLTNSFTNCHSLHIQRFGFCSVRHEYPCEI
jgi:hypothetical protein